MIGKTERTFQYFDRICDLHSTKVHTIQAQIPSRLPVALMYDKDKGSLHGTAWKIGVFVQGGCFPYFVRFI